MGGLNLEVAKFGMYIMFPIGFMYYFGTNLDNRFSVHDFWPRPEETNTVPKDRSEIAEEYQRIMTNKRVAEERRRAAAALQHAEKRDS